jgi:hypothetical protein
VADSDGPAYRGVLIYDGERPSCSAAASALRRVGNIGAIPRYDGPARAFLEAQFEDGPFALVFVDNEETGCTRAGGLRAP